MPSQCTGRKPRRAPVVVPCPVCGTPFRVLVALLERGRRYCSRPCYWESLKISEPLADRFWRHIRKSEGCWVWTGAHDQRGYGQMGRDGKTVRSTRVAWELHHGPVPDGLWVLHRCDNPPCVRPDHLFLGTSRDNHNDMWKKGRGKTARIPGELHPSAALSNTQARDLRARWAAGGVTQTALAREYGTSLRVVNAIVRGRTYRDV